MGEVSSTNTDRLVVTLPVGRVRALVRGTLWASAALLLAVIAMAIYGGLHFRPTAVSNRLVDYGVAALVLPLPLAALLCGWKALPWLLLSSWPGGMGIVADTRSVIMRLGPFGTQRYDVARLEVSYPYELADSETDTTFESFLPREQQLDQLLPQMVYAPSKEHIELVILKFVSCSEEEAAKAFRPVIQRWRAPETDEVHP